MNRCPGLSGLQDVWRGGHRWSIERDTSIRALRHNRNVLTVVEAEQLPRRCVRKPGILGVPCPPAGLQLLQHLLRGAERRLLRQPESAHTRDSATLLVGHRPVAVQEARGVRLRGVALGEHTASGAPGGVLRPCVPVARWYCVHAAARRERGGAGDHAEFGAG